MNTESYTYYIIKRSLLIITLMSTAVCGWAQNAAKIAENEYVTLKVAVDAANESAEAVTITLLTDVTIENIDSKLTITKPVTLDMASHTITSTIEEPFLIDGTGSNTGALNITGNGTITGPYGADGAVHDGKAMITVNGANAKLKYLNGTLTCGGSGSDGMYGVYILNSGSAVFGNESDHSGPSITSWFAAIGENNTTAPADITIYGGEYKQLATPSESDWWEYFCTPVYASASGSITIAGGTFTGRYGFASRYGNVEQSISISGGTFNGSKEALLIGTVSDSGHSGTRNIAVSGGTFSSEVPSEYCAEGFELQDLGDGKYGVLYVFNMTDETDLTDMDGKTVNATYTRSAGMNAVDGTSTKYGTICLPFTITAPTQGITLYKATSINGSTLTITEVTDYPIAAGTPLIFQLSTASTTMTVTSNNATVSTAAPAKSTANGNILVGTFTATDITTGLTDIYYLNGDKFHQAQVSLSVPAYRAYMKVSESSPAKPRMISIAKEGEETTGIINALTLDATTEIYDLNGIKQNALQRGMNIMRRADGASVKVLVK